MRKDVYIRLRGGMLEKLINRAVDAGAVFSSLRQTRQNEWIVSCDVKSRAILQALCDRYGIDTKLLRLGALYALLTRIRARWTLLPALLLTVAILLLFFSHVWIIDIAFIGAQPDAGSVSQIRARLLSYGVKCGMPVRNLRSDQLEKQLLSASEGYSYAGIRLQGVRLLIELAPETPAPKVYDIRGARDLVAERDGVIESIEVRSGTACVCVGDTVRKGQALILGEERQTAEETAAVSALGEVRARCWYEGSSESARRISIEQKTGGVRVSKTLRLFSARLPLKSCEAFAREETQIRRQPLVGLYLPLELETVFHYETQQKSVSADEDRSYAHLEALARSDALRKISLPSGSYGILQSWTERQTNDHSFGVRAVYEISTNIAVSRDELAKEEY